MTDTVTNLCCFMFILKIFDRMASPVTMFYISILTIISVSTGFSYDRSLTDEITIKQGTLVGLKVEFKSSLHLRPVEVYLGIPYAAAPTGSQRFMPPGSPPPWTGVKFANKHPAVCPQNPPDINEERKKMTMSEGRAKYLRRLLPYLVRDQQDEDCLYLNIFSPAQKRGLQKSKSKYPVIVFIHGESFEWNSGNPYDGSVLASYGEVVVVTINFRLGILGFLRPGIGDTVTNFGLLDQIAALQWIKENIEKFGGDSKCVTLMGHGTGAACVNYLMVSPVSRGVGGSGLFHRAILMSGTALADWALTTSNVFTIQVAQALNCPLKATNNEMTECLQKRRLDEIMAVKVEAPEFKTRFGPMVDGNVVPNDPFHVTGEYKDLFSRYELLYGVTELESYNLLDAVSLHYGMLEQDRDKKIRSYVQERFEYLPDMYLAETLKAYTDVTRRSSESSSQSIAENNRNTLLDILSDARVVAPMVQTANFHSSANPKSYFYVFSHRNTYGDYESARIGKSVHGEELPYVFGVPLVNGNFSPYPFSTPEQGFPSHPHFTDAERLLSEAIITFWTNFAKTGNPNAPSRKLFLTQADLDWTEYDTTNKTYLSLGIPPKVSHHYRQKLMNFWNDHITDMFKNLPPNESSKNEERPEILPPEPYPRLPFFPFHPERNTDIITWHNGLPVFSSTPRPHVYGTVVKSQNEKPRSASTGLLGVDNGFGSKYQQTSTSKVTEVAAEVDADNSSSMAMSIVIVVGVCFLLVNLCAFAGLYYQRDRLKVQERLMKKRYEDVENTNNEDYYVRKLPEQQDDGENATLEKIDKKENKKKKAQVSGDELYEAVRSREKTLDGKDDMIEEEEAAKVGFKKWKLSRQCSASTMDPHTKVREWIAHEIVQRCSPRFLRRTKFQQPANRSMVQNDSSFDTFVEKDSSANAPAVSKNQTPSSPALSKPTTTTLQRSKVKKVSVAVDATPAARGASVLKQIPVEQMSKSMEELGLGKCISTTEITLQEKRAALKRSETCRESLARSSSSSDPNNRDTVLRRSTSINLQLYQPSNKIQNNGFSISHQHSKSDPVPHSTKQNLPKSSNVQNPQMTYISVDSRREPQDAYSTGFPQKQFRSFKSGPNLKGKTGREVPVSVMPISNICRDINVTSRDSCEKNEQLPHADPLKTIQRRNFPKVLPDLPSSQEIKNFDQDSAMDLTPLQAISAKRRSLPPPLYLLVETEASESDAGSVSQPTTPTNAYQKDVNIYGQAGKVPPPPPPRISSTLGRKPNNVAPVAPISSSFDSQDSVNVNTSTPSAICQQRQEPRFIIKPTSTAPVTRNPSVLQQGRAKQIPRVVPNSGEEYPLTPTAAHHQYYNTTSPSEITSSVPSLNRQNSIRNQISQPSTVLKHPPQSQVQPCLFEASKEKKHLQSFEEIHNLHKTLPTSYPSVPKEPSSLEPITHYPIKSRTQQHAFKTSPTQGVEASTTTLLQGKPKHQQKVPSKKSTETLGISSLSTEDTSSNTGTVRRVKKEINSKNQGTGGNSNVEASSPTKTTAASKAWYAQYNQSFLSKSKDSDN